MNRNIAELQSETAIQNFKAQRDPCLSYQIYSMNILKCTLNEMLSYDTKKRQHPRSLLLSAKCIYRQLEASKT